ncbi:MAG: organomercurial lyase, partial [Flavobacteriaceae bacterium]
ITTTLGGESKQTVIEIVDGKIVNDDLFVHFPIPMAKAWDNVTFTCSTMLMFESKEDVEDWCRRHSISMGDVQAINKIWEFSKVWYGKHLDQDWTKWSVEDAKKIFNRFELDHSIWQLPTHNERF